MQEGDHQVKQGRAAQHVHKELLVELKQLPEEHVDLLREVDLLDGVGEVGLT